MHLPAIEIKRARSSLGIERHFEPEQRAVPQSRTQEPESDGSALRRRYKKALEKAATIVEVQAWMGHADVQTTMKYTHHRSRAGDARLLSAAFRPKKKKPSRKATSPTSAA